MTKSREKPLPPPPPKVTPKRASTTPAPTPPAATPPAPAVRPELEAEKRELADTVPVVIIPPVDADTLLVMENQTLKTRVAAFELEVRQILKTAMVDYSRLAKLLE